MRGTGAMRLLTAVSISVTFLCSSHNLFATSQSLHRARRQIEVSRFQSYWDTNGTAGTHDLEQGPWEPWSEKSECSRSCGLGVQYQERICRDLRSDGRHTCIGASRRYFACNVEDCPTPRTDFRSEQCERFNSVPYKGNYFYSWQPYYGVQAENPCELLCKPRGGSFYAKLDRKVIDGTRCRNDASLDVCVNGHCMEVGCNKVLGSKTSEDECGVCGGDGTSCQLIKGTLDHDNFQVGYNDILLIPAGATSLLIEEVHETPNYLAIRNLTGHYYLNGNWRIDTAREVRVAGSVVHYSTRPTESIRGRGPFLEPIFIVLLYHKKNLGISYEYTVPATTRVDTPDSYSWTTGDFEECSASCGGGIRSRPVRCVRSSNNDIVEEELCDLGQKPAENVTCNVDACPSEWQVGEWSDCSASCGGGSHYRLVFCRQAIEGRTVLLPDESCPDEKPVFMRACNLDASCPDWQVGNWSQCDRSCGTGNQTRTVECLSEVGKGPDESTCDTDAMPAAWRECSMGPCGGVEWIVSDWSGCDGSCSPHMQSRSVHCANEEGEVFPEDVCDAPKRPHTTQACSATKMCDAMWHASQWSQCSVQCGSGVQSRVVFCGAWENDSVIRIEEEHCDPDQRFEPLRNCSEDACQGLWFTGPWDRCSVPCGGGERTRKILCFHETTVVDDDKCDATQQPFHTESCNMTPCDEDEMIMDGGCVNSTFGCCPDGSSVSGPSGQGCPSTDIDSLNTTCEEAEFGCCADNFTLAQGPFRKGCPPTGPCNATKFGCCPDKTTPATGEDMEGCPPETARNCSSSSLDVADLDACPFTDENCENSTFGCCPDGMRTAIGPDNEGCDDEVTLFPDDGGSGEDCYSTVYGCCPDGMSPANGTDQDGCDGQDANATTCKTSAFGCCDDDFTFATGPRKDGCSDGSGELDESCESSVFGCCPDNITLSKGFDFEGCYPEDCSNATFGCCADNETVASGPDFQGCMDPDCDNTSYGCCPGTEIISGPDNQGCPVECSNTTFGCCPDNTTAASGHDLEGCMDMDCSMGEFGCCADNQTSATGPDYQGCLDADCANTTYGCCPDSEIISGPDNEGCPVDCANTTYGCCPDSDIISGPDNEGCPVNCANTTYGCCPDSDIISGPDNEGCPVDCSNTTYGCCPDNTTAASGADFEGCEETVVTEDDMLTTTSAPACANTTFGCCPDEVTEALGRNLEGCCFGMRFGCCPDNKTAALGPSFLGCSCQTFPYGCCPDLNTPAQGFNYRGCKCEHFRYGCCQDRVTPATGPHFEGCICLQMAYGCCPDGITPKAGFDGDAGCGCGRFGCCPDGRTPARGPDMSGCPCDSLPHGCCPDGRTPAPSQDPRDCPCTSQRFGCCVDGRTMARGPNYEGCPCDTTRFGCCPDGGTAAQGPDQYGCPCDGSRFGCCADGYTAAKGPRFEGCPDVKQPKPTATAESCGLPKESGPCRNFSIQWFFDVSYGSCSRFWYGGCDGNDNRFAAEADCQRVCVTPEGPDACLLPKTPGSCNEKIPLWYYDAGSKTCEQFTYGGCYGNNNKFVTKDECQQNCIDLQQPTPVDVCSLAKDEGSCERHVVQWYFNQANSRCEQFYYGGCQGNGNRFETRKDCEKSCLRLLVTEPEGDVCRLPRETGSCSDFVERWFFDEASGECGRFMFGGCQGNANNFGSYDECRLQCAPASTPAPQPFRIEYCFETHKDAGGCSDNEIRWSYDSADGVCKQFYYGGCGGTRNRFATRKDCETSCSQAQDICSLVAVKGPCSGSFTQWHYDKDRRDCLEFVFSGCQGNANRFNNRESCYQRCDRDKLTTPAPPPVGNVCNLPQEPGPCLEYFPAWYYDNSDNQCKQFVFGGCEGNGNRFEDRADCEQQCVRKKARGPDPQPPYDRTRMTNEDVCRLPVESGPCGEEQARWFYDATSASCLPFVYGGCHGNTNRFKTAELCLKFCGGVAALPASQVTTPPPTIAPPSPTDAAPSLPCPASNCYDIQCPYGIEETFDPRGCSSCRCANPCEDHSCPDGSRCAIDVVRTSREAIRTEPVCRRIRKPGQCPSIEAVRSLAGGDCETRCRDDADCRGEHKCCSNGCAMTCVAPEEEGFTGANQPEAATILPGPNVTEAQVGEPAELPCQARGWPRPTVTWWRETTMLPLSSRRFQQLPTYALLIRSVAHEDAGDYSCVAHNGVGSGATFKVTLIIETVDDFRDSEPIMPTAMALPPAPSGLLPPPPAGELPPPPARELPPPPARELPPPPARELPPPPARELPPPATSQPTQPEFVHLETRVAVVTPSPTAGSPLQVACEVRGPPAAAVTWQLDGRPLVESERVRFLSNHTLFVTRATVDDSGEYTCTANLGSSTSSAGVFVQVRAPPEDTTCVDNPQFKNCEVIVNANYCNNKIYGKYCCASCLRAGQLQSFAEK